MTIRYKRAAACLLAFALLILLFAGCGNAGDPAQTTPSSQTGSSAPDTEESGPQPGGNGTPDGASTQGKPDGEAAQTAPDLAETDEERLALTGGKRLAKWGNTLLYTSDDGIYIADLEKGELRLLTDARANKVYFDGEWVYYSPMFEAGIFRADLSGNVEKLSDSSALQLWLTEDRIYFTKQRGTDEINHTPQGDLCVMDRDGGKEETLIPDVKNYFVLSEDRIYYTDWNSRAMYRAELDGSGRELMVKGRVYITMAGGGYVHYIDYNDSEAHCRLNTVTKEKQILGYFGADLHFNGKTYVMTRVRDASGSPATDWTIFRIDPDTGEASEWGKRPMGLDFLLYEYDGWGYYGGYESGVFRALSGSGETEAVTGPYEYTFFLDGYGYCPLGPEDGSSVFGRLEVLELFSGERTMLALEK